MNGHPIVEGVITIMSLIVGIAAIAVVVSPKAQTSQVIQATASGFVNSLATAEAPVTGNNVNIVSSYPSSGFGIPSLSGANLTLN
jgi:hypothetical protein